MASKGSKSPYGNTDRGILQAIGLSVVNYSQLTNGLVLGVSCLLIGKLSDDATELLVGKLPFRSLLETFGGLYRHRFPDDDFSDLDKVCQRIEKINEERNRLAHSSWTRDKAADKLRRYRTEVRRRGPKIWDESLSEEDVLRFAERVDLVNGQLLDFIIERIWERIEDVRPKHLGRQ